MRPYGDPACGTYLLVATDRLAGAPEALRDEIGECQLLFEPSEGDAARAESGGRLLLALHGGRIGADNRLRPTAGGLRVRGHDLEMLLRVLSSEEEWRLEVREEVPKMLAAELSDEPAGAGIDPPVPFSAEAQRAIERRGSSPASSDDDSWRHRHDDDWRSSRDNYSSSGPAVAAATGAAVGAAAAHRQKYPSRPCLLPSLKAAQTRQTRQTRQTKDPPTLPAARVTDCRALPASPRLGSSLTSRALRARAAVKRSTSR